jgi:hypothetical protein
MHLERDTLILVDGIRKIGPTAVESNLVGFCEGCGTELWSIAYYSTNGRRLVSAACRGCKAVFAVEYDMQWRWIRDIDIGILQDRMQPEGWSEMAQQPEPLRSMGQGRQSSRNRQLKPDGGASHASRSVPSDGMNDSSSAKGAGVSERNSRLGSLDQGAGQDQVLDEVVVSTLPSQMLSDVFTKAEIRDMIACEEGRPFVRQNLYRARAKYQLFKERFGIEISL